jgi:phosphonoacetaldehyde hydrolase
MLEMPLIAAAWRDAHGADWTVADLDRLYEQFTPLQVQCLPHFSALVPGVAEAVDRLRARGVAVAATTGYNSEMAAVVREEAARQGFRPDAAVCASDVAGGRPAPWMVFRALEALDVANPEAAVCIGDTIPDIESGLNAGTWSVGVAATGNMMGLPRAEYEALDAPERETRLRDARERMYAAGAHYVIDAFPDLAGLLDEIEERLRRGETP